MSLVALILILVSSMMVLPSSQVVGQSNGDETYCGDLSEADCTLLRASDEAWAELQSVVYDARLTVDVAADDEPLVSFALGASGEFDSGAEEIDAVTDEILDMRVREVLELFDDPDELMSTALGYAERILSAPAVSLDFEATAVIEDEMSGPLNFQLRVVDGVVYGNSELLAEAGMPAEQWISLDMVQVVNMLAEALQNPDLWSGMMGGMDGGPGMGGMASPDDDDDEGGDEFMEQIARMSARFAEIQENPAWEAMDSEEFMARIFTVERIEGNEIDGVPVAVFEMTLDFAAMADSEEFQSVLRDIFSLYDFMPEEEREALYDVSLDIMDDMTWSMTQAVGLEDNQVYHFGFTGEQVIDIAEIAASFGEDLDDDDPMIQTTTYAFTLTMTGHNEPVDVEAPDASDVISVFQLLGMAGPPPSAELESSTAIAVPEGWEEADAGFSGMTVFEGPDGELLMIGSFPGPSAMILPMIAGNAGFEDVPEPSEERNINGVTWTFYEGEVDDDGVVLFAVASPDEGTTQLVLVGGAEEDRDRLEADVYEPALESQSTGQ